MEKLLDWFLTLLSGRPHFVIGSPPYLLRWYLIPRNRWMNCYLHKFLRDDDDRALHDHPWWFVSLMLRGGYREFLPCPQCNRPDCKSRPRRAPSISFRRAEHRHRVVLQRDADGNPIPCWTLLITGRNVREWGFWCNGTRFVHWRRFVAPHNPGEVGRGCG